MDEFLKRQITVLRKLIEDYRQKSLALNALIQRIEGVNTVVANERWSNAIFPIVLSLEQVNAIVLEEKRELSVAETTEVEGSLLALEAFINDLDTE
ncbi:hypothetical protein FHT32_000408 [Variovorax sp. SG517]|uniref:hypothetical protein n=1 Tax=Variovorax sp. SG517 TaxID=2587117 RepID=UPI00159D1B73|nr:hypothetical protein [Variovorax sp. SG517]NVM86785.1 hypothetical protein [Variovorax sp. SG517]